MFATPQESYVDPLASFRIHDEGKDTTVSNCSVIIFDFVTPIQHSLFHWTSTSLRWVNNA